MQGWLRIPKKAAEYSDVSPRKVEDWLHDGLKYVKVKGCRLTKPEWIDQFLSKFEVNHNEVDAIVDEVMKSL